MQPLSRATVRSLVLGTAAVLCACAGNARAADECSATSRAQVETLWRQLEDAQLQLEHAQAHSREKTVGADYAEWLADRISLLAQACSLPEYVSALRQRQALTHSAMAEGGPPPGRSHTENAQEVESGDAPSTETGADGGEAVDPEQAEVVLVTVVFNQVEMLAYQVHALRTHVKESIQMIVVVNSPWGPIREEFLQLSESLGVRAVVPPEDLVAKQASYGSEISRNHSAAIDWAWRNILVPEYGSVIVAILDPDIFPLGPVSFVERMRGEAATQSPNQRPPDTMCHIRGLLGGNVPCVGRCEPGTYVAFMLAWLIVFDMEFLPDKDSISFLPIIHRGIQLDSGGALAEYFERHGAFDLGRPGSVASTSEAARLAPMSLSPGPRLRVCSMHSYTADPNSTDLCLGRFPSLPTPVFMDGAFLHAGSLGSDWDVDYIAKGWGGTAGSSREKLEEQATTQFQVKALKRKCVLDLVEDALFNSLNCEWRDYAESVDTRLPNHDGVYPAPPACVWSSL